VVELERTVNASGNVSLGERILSAGLPLAGQRVTLQLDEPVAHILSGGVLVRTLACPVPSGAPARLRGARPGARPAAPPARILVVTWRVPGRGPVMAGGQKIQAGPPHARKTVSVTVGPGPCQVAVEPGGTITRPRTASRDIGRHKAGAPATADTGLPQFSGA
jgi:hypothetical protein